MLPLFEPVQGMFAIALMDCAIMIPAQGLGSVKITVVEPVHPIASFAMIV